MSKQFRVLKVGAAFTFFGVMFTAWWVSTAWRDAFFIQPSSLAYLLFVPSVLGQDALAPLGKVQVYRYSAGDGPKPETVWAEVQMSGDVSSARERLRRHFIGQGFSPEQSSSLVRGREEIAIEDPDACMSNCVVRVVWLHY